MLLLLIFSSTNANVEKCCWVLQIELFLEHSLNQQTISWSIWSPVCFLALDCMLLNALSFFSNFDFYRSLRTQECICCSLLMFACMRERSRAELGTLCILDKCSTNELFAQPRLFSWRQDLTELPKLVLNFLCSTERLGTCHSPASAFLFQCLIEPSVAMVWHNSTPPKHTHFRFLHVVLCLCML